ncbi:MAG: hemin uptake protein HemP [Paracoccaceae bacterium]
MTARFEPPAAPGARLAPAEATPPEHDARSLTRGGLEARIVLDGVAYVLRITRQGKLILTK